MHNMLCVNTVQGGVSGKRNTDFSGEIYSKLRVLDRQTAKKWEFYVAPQKEKMIQKLAPLAKYCYSQYSD